MARYIITASDADDEQGGKAGFASAPYSKFQQRHPSYDPEYWERLECLYKGGKELLENKSVMDKIFPKHRGEHPEIYRERRECAHYIPFAGEIVGNTVMGVFSDPMNVGMEEEDANLPEFYAEFVEDTSRPGKKTQCSMAEFVSKMLLDALIKQCAWAQVDLPRVEGEFADRQKEDAAGARRAYLVSITPENVIDWEVDEDDDLIWAITKKQTNRRSSPDSDRSKITEEFTVFDREGFQVFEHTYDADKPPDENTRVRLVADGPHTFKAVPLIRLKLPHALWAMNKMESACRALLRDLNSLEWAVRQSLHQELYEFLGSEYGDLMKKVGEAQGDAKRAINQQRGQGYVQLRGADDSAEYVGPPTEGFEFALKLVNSHRDEMHRVNNQSGVNSDITAASKQQSAEAKREETASAENLYRETGKHVREFTKDLLQAAAAGRNEDDKLDGVDITGLTKFNERTTEGHLENATLVQGLEIASPTFQRAFQLDAAKVHGADFLSPGQIETIEEELEANIVAEDFEGNDLSDEELAAALALKGREVGGKPGKKPADTTWSDE